MKNKVSSFIQVKDIYDLWFEPKNNKFHAYPVHFACLCEDEDGDSKVEFMDVVCCNKDGDYYPDSKRKSENFCGYFHKDEICGVEGIEFTKFDTSKFKPEKHS